MRNLGLSLIGAGYYGKIDSYRTVQRSTPLEKKKGGGYIIQE